MDKEQIFASAKSEMLHIVKDLSIDDLAEGRKRLTGYLDFLDSLSRLNCPEVEDSPEGRKAQVSEIGNDQPDSSLPPEGGKPDYQGYLFERKLKGGFIPDLDVYVPEKVIRKLGLTHGDWVKATRTKGNYYEFELVKKEKGMNEDRGEIKYCIVEKDGELWVCHRTLSGRSIHLDDMPFTVRLKESEIQTFHLEEGDIVDVAYAKDNPTICKVVWKHKIKDVPPPSPLPSGFYKERSPHDHDIQEHPDLKGKKITLIGCINRYPTYRERFTALGSEVYAMDGTEDDERIAATIKKSDMVLMIIPAVSHGGTAAAKKHCKAYDIPFSTIDSIGISSVVNGAVDLARAIGIDTAAR
ncbi:MAG TPA: DUF2325 domain-containing protein [Bacillales bacterium]|nr:DUF2325 domain-containing protein [Bacillales bacterium]